LRVSLALLISLVALAAAACRETHTVLRPGDGGETRTISSVTAGDFHSCAIAGGALYCWGSNDDGRLGLGDTMARTSPTRVGTDDDWRVVAAGENSTVALKQDGSLWAWGLNDQGQLGLGDLAARQVPTRVGTRTDWTSLALRFNHACATATDRSLWCWGDDEEGQLAKQDTADLTSPTLISDDRDWIAADAGQGHSCGIHADGTLDCWGRNSESELGQGSSDPLQIRRPIQVGTDADWQTVQAGQQTTCGLRSGALYCWGRNLSSTIPDASPNLEIGLPTALNVPAPLAEVSLNTFGACARNAAGDGFCWGRNVEGQLGVGDTTDRAEPTALPMGGWTQFSVGRFSTCGARGGTVYCTGDNRDGQLGTGDLERRDTFTAVVLP
jgi:alpha-tubulin suppressor-like RCC1 family protein